MSKKHPGAAIRKARRAEEMPQAQLAKIINRSPAYMARFELGYITAKPAEIVAMRIAIKAHRSAKEAA